MIYLCAYCQEPAIWDPHVDENGIGWMANCCKDDCEYLAQRDAGKQRAAKKKAGAEGPSGFPSGASLHGGKGKP